MKKITALILAALMLLSVGFAFADTAPGFYDDETGRIRMTHKRYIRPDYNDYETVGFGYAGYEVYLNAAVDADWETLVDLIVAAAENGEAADIYARIFSDPEKYETVGFYDSELCWAATAANMLWQAGYAQVVRSPYTGRYFESPDEVFDLFRKNYYNEGGFAPEGLADFMAFFGYEVDPSEYVAELLEDPDKISVLESFVAGAFGVSLRGIDPATGEILMAHAVTVSGVVYDEEGEIVGIVFADSDTDIPVPEYLDVIAPWERPRAAIASNVVDSVKYYPLVKVEIEGVECWEVVGYASFPVIIKTIYAIPNL